MHRIARRGSQSGVRKVLARLEQHGLVDVVETGPSHLYSLNRDHVAAPAVLALRDLRGVLFARIRTLLSAWPTPAVAAAVFGSAARGDGGPDSDIDLVVVRPTDTAIDSPDWADGIADLGVWVRRWSGNPASILQASPAQVVAMVDRDEPIVKSLRRDAIALTERRVLDVTELSP